MKQVVGGVLMATALVVTSAQASDDEWDVALGIGVGASQSPYKGVGTETDVLPLLMIEKGNFSLSGPKASYDLYSSDVGYFSVLAAYRGEGFDASDSSDLTGMADRDGAFEMGLGAGMYTSVGEFSIEFLSDVSSEHDGYEVELGWENSFPLSDRCMLSPNASISYRSDDLNNHYYGVRASEATATRAAYTADAGMVGSLGVDAIWMIDEQQSLMMGVGIEFYGDEIKDSSIVDRDNSVGGHVAYVYRF